MRKKVRFTMLAMVLTFSTFGIAYRANGNSTYRSNYNSTYGTNVACTFCHTSPPTLNPTGTKLKNSGFNYASIAPVPQVTSFSIPATSTDLTVPITTFTATDNIPITGYMITESSTPPGVSAAGWSASVLSNYTFASAGAKTLYAWAKDAADVVSPSMNASTTITLAPAPDTTPPTVNSFTLPSTSSSLIVPISSFSATDNVGVTGYLVTESASTPSSTASGWTASSPSNYTFTTAGTKTLYAWAKDAAGNVSTSLSAQVTITLPPAPDTTPPSIISFSIPPTSSSLIVPISSFSATDNVGVTGYLVAESASTPSSSAPGWAASSPSNYTFTTAGTKTLYAWAKDAAGNVSTSLSAQVTITLPPAPDTTPPTVNSFTIPPTSSSLTVPISSFSATDNVGVTGYLVTESASTPSASASGWAASPPPSYTFTTAGAKTLYAWAKDAAGNVSPSKSAQVTITLTPVPTPSQDMTIWIGQWFKLTTQIVGSCSGSSGLIGDSGSFVGYLKLWQWDPNNNVLKGDLYEYDTATSEWSSQSLPLLFIAGSDLDFICQSQATDNAANSTQGFTARIVGKETAGALKSATFRSLGGYYIDALDQSGTIVHCAGGFKLTGTLILESKVPVPRSVQLH